MPETGCRGVLITRPAADAAVTAERIRALGFQPVIAPVSIVHEHQIAPVGPFDAVITTSRNAVPALHADLHPIPLLAVGSATAARARAAGFFTVLNAEGDGAALAALAARLLSPGARLLFAHGQGQGDAVAAALEASGFTVTRECAYAVEPATHMPDAAIAALEARNLHAATFLSAETAGAFVRLMPARLRPALGSVHAIAIGAPAAAILAHLPWRDVRTAFKPTLDDVLALL